MAEDEEVVLEGSELYNHLRASGFNDFEFTEPLNKNAGFNRNLQDQNFIYQTDVQKWNGFNVSQFINRFYVDQQDKRNAFGRIAHILIQSKLLEESDLLTLEHFSPSFQEIAELWEDDSLLSSNSNSPIFVWPFSRIGSSLMLLTPLVASATFLLGGESGRLFSIGIGLGVISLLLLDFSFKRFHTSNYTKIEESFREICLVLGKSLKATVTTFKSLNEIQVLGKSLSNKNHSWSNPDKVFSQSLTEGLTTILKSLSLWAIKNHKILMNATATSGETPINILFDLEQRGTGMSHEGISIKDLGKVAFSQCSSLLAELFLHIEREQTDVNILHSIATNLIQTTNEKRIHLENSNKLFKSFWLDNNSNRLSRYSLGGNKHSSNYFSVDLHKAVESLFIHTKSSFIKAVEFRDWVESLDEPLLEEEMQNRCLDIEKSLDSCSLFLQDVVDKMCKKSSIETISNVNKLTFTELEKIENQPKIVEFVDPKIQDEVFEASISDVLPVRDDKEPSRERFHQKRNDKNIIKRQKEKCRRVLEEIQPILSERRIMWAEREQKALDRMQKEDPPNCLPSVTERKVVATDDCSDSIKELPLITFDKGVLEFDMQGAPSSFGCNESVDCGATNCSEEYDSEEERLNLYRKVRAELDEDERKRNEISIDEGTSKSAIKSSGKMSRFKINWEEPGVDEENVNEERSFSQICETVDNKEVEETTRTSESQKSETFACGSSDEEDSSSNVIDWSTCGFPTVRNLPLDVRLSSVSMGLPLDVLNSPVDTVLKKRGFIKLKEEEIFGGVGEGVSDSDEQSDIEDL